MIDILFQVNLSHFLESAGNRVPTLVGVKITSVNLDDGSRAVHADNGRFVVFYGSNEVRIEP